MKKTKRILAVILSLLIMTIVPLNAFAAKLVDTIDLTVNVEPGMKMENYEDYITINTPGVTFYDEAHVFISEVLEGGSYYPSSDTFEPGCVYELIIILDVTDGYVFAQREVEFKSVTVNGEDAYIEAFLDEEYEETEYYAVYATVETDNCVKEIDITVDTVAGYMIDDYYRYVKINSMGIQFEESLDDGVNVTDSLGGDPFDYFVEDEEYVLEICLTPAYGCEFLKDDEGNIRLESVTVNGEDIKYDAYIQDSRGYLEYVIIKLNVIPAAETAITIIDITVDENLKGCDVEDYEEYITIETDGVSFDTYDPYAVFAYDSFYNDVYTYEGGENYWICMNFVAEDGYFFDPVGVVIRVNGEDYAYVDYDSYEPEDGITVEYVYAEYNTGYLGNFFDRVIAWFRNIFETIGNFLFGWIPF